MQLTLVVLGLLILVTLAFWPALNGGFIFDDYPIFAENSTVHVTGWHWQEWHRVWAWSRSNIERPIAMLSYALNYALGGSTRSFKATNLALHLFNALLLMQLARRLLFAGWVQVNGVDARRHRWIISCWAIVLATLWAIHPLQVSTVMYTVQRMELLGFAFVLLALLAYWRARQRQMEGQRAWPWLGLCCALTVIGYYAKETAVLVPGYALLLELTLLHFAAHKSASRRAWKITYLAGCSIAALIFTFYLLPHYATDSAYAARDYNAWQRELTQLRVLPLYLGWILLPLPNLLHFYYDNYPISRDLLHPITTLFGGLLLLGLAVFAVALRKRRPLLALGIGWFFVAQTLTSAPIPLELVFEHRNYPALFGIVLAVADLLWLITRRVDPRIATLIAGILIANFGLLTFIRSSIWGDRLLLTQTLADDNPGSARAAYDLARRYMFMAGNNPDSPFYSLSIKELRRAATLPSASPMAEEALLLINADHHDQPDVSTLWSSFLDKLQNRPLGPEAYLALDKLTTERLSGKTGIDIHQLARAYEITIKRNPARITLHSSYAELAGAELHDPDLAIQQWRQALRLEKDLAGYSKQLAGYLLENHRGQEALAVIAEARKLQPMLSNDPILMAMQSQAEKMLSQEGATALPQQSQGLTDGLR
ncbi:hypothetical protein ISN76_15735 [Dyella halodurans]|uniref:Tetratricopeptide repeat protein n=1 Tax=Dyella halodurans TaxID=1920171 RepID=A0ABV9C608_9GAMM|nr:hypothetical protein [Dyella halodurans]